MSEQGGDFERHLAQAKQRLVDAGECTAAELTPPAAPATGALDPGVCVKAETRPGWKKVAVRLLVALNIGLAVVELWGALEQLRGLEE